jgi:hypothetical protein
MMIIIYYIGDPFCGIRGTAAISMAIKVEAGSVSVWNLLSDTGPELGTMSVVRLLPDGKFVDTGSMPSLSTNGMVFDQHLAKVTMMTV